VTLTISPIVEESIARADSYGDGDGGEFSGMAAEELQWMVMEI
jgi:hypothetical protein